MTEQIIEPPSSSHYPLPLPRLATDDPDRVALTWRGAPVTRAELARSADDVAHRLRALGVGQGDRVAALLPDEPEFAVLVHGLARLGAVLVPLGIRWTAQELEWPIENTDPQVIVHAPGFQDRLPVESAALRIVARPGSLLSSEPVLGEPVNGDPVMGVNSDISGSKRAGVHLSEADLLAYVPLDAAQAIIHTSGTTGRPKGAVLTWENQVWSAMGSALRLGVRADDRWLAPLPLHHVGGLAILLRSAFYGTAAALPGRIDATGLSEALEREPISIVSLVPTQLARLLDVRGDRPAPKGLRVVLIGGGPASDGLLRRAHSLGYPLAPTYGLSEAASQVATCAPGWSPEGGERERQVPEGGEPVGPVPEGGERERQLPEGGEQVGALGPAAPPLSVCEVRVTDGAGHVLEAGEAGGIEVRGPIVMPGYWRDMEATRSAIVDGWLRTGDLGLLDSEGRLVVLGRRADLIVTGGENVYPAEVESVLEAHPDVAACCVVGIADEVWGEAVVAVIEGAGGRAPEAGDLERFARTRLAGYKAPRRFVMVAGLPRTANGKVRRGEVRRRLEEE